MSATEGAIVEAGAIDKYSWVGPLYEVMGDVWSFNQIPKVKVSHHGASDNRGSSATRPYTTSAPCRILIGFGLWLEGL